MEKWKHYDCLFEMKFVTSFNQSGSLPNIQRQIMQIWSPVFMPVYARTCLYRGMNGTVKISLCFLLCQNIFSTVLHGDPQLSAPLTFIALFWIFLCI